MLSIASIGRPGYFLELANAEYYSEGGERPGEWFQVAADSSKYDGTVTEEALLNLLAGKSRDGQRQLVKPHPHRQQGWDLTFSAPKSVSVLYALAPREIRETVLQAQRQAVIKALEYLLANAVWQRRGAGGSQFVPVASIAAAFFTHISSRSGDPQLHIHVLLANLGLGNDGKYRTIWSHDIYQHMKAAGAIYRLELAFLLQKLLGLVIISVKDWFKVAGISSLLCKMFSKRSEEIQRLARKFGESHPRFLELLTKITRGVKMGVSHEKLHAQWAKAAATLKFTQEHIMKLLNRFRPQLSEKKAQRVASRAASMAIQELAQHHSYFTERQIIEKLTPHLMAKGRGADLAYEALRIAKDKLYQLQVSKERYEYFTTHENYELEKKLIDMAKTYGRKQQGTLVSLSWLLKVLDAARKSLSRSQRVVFDENRVELESAVRDWVCSPESIRILQGKHGTGKTTTLALTKIAYEKLGCQVIVCAPTAASVKELRRHLGGDCLTVASLLRIVHPTLNGRLKHAAKQLWRKFRGKPTHRYGEKKLETEQKAIHYYRQLKRLLKLRLPGFPGYLKLDKKTVILVDNAEKLDTQSAHDLVKVVEKAGSKLRMAFNPSSPASAGPGSSLLYLAEHLSTFTLAGQHRSFQETWQREAHVALEMADSEKFLKIFRKQGAFRESASHEEAINELVKAWMADKKTPLRDKVILASDEDELDALNKAVQAARKQKFGVSLGGVKLSNGERIATGDRVRFEQNNRYLGIDSGDFGKVISVARHKTKPWRKRIWIRVEEKKRWGFLPKVVRIDTKRYSHLKLAYALKPSQLESRVKHAYVLVNPGLANNANMLHQVSRATHRTQLFGVKLNLKQESDLLAKNLKKTQRKMLAHHYEEQQLKKQNFSRAM